MSGPTGFDLFPLDRALRGIRERFADAVIDSERTSLRERVVVVPAGRLAEVAGAVANEWGGMLLTFFGLDERERHGRFRLHAMFSMAPEDALLTLVAAVPETAPAYPSLTPRVPAAHWLERELRDLLGVTPTGHPDLRPVVSHAGWPAGMHPWRKDFVAPPDDSWPPRFTVPPVAGEGVFEIPVGPVGSGLEEPAHLRFSTDGEHVLALEVRLGWAWRGLEVLAEGESLTRGLELAERLCGTCSFAHALAFCHAAEELAGVVVPPRARALRSFAAELERIASHLGDMTAIVEEAGWVTGAAEFARLHEMVRRACGQLFGHRFLRGVCTPGGVLRDLDDAQQLWLRRLLGDLREGVARAVASALGNASVMERLTGAGVLPAALARELGVTGVAARASGVSFDGRRDHPFAFYRDLDFQVVTRTGGDVLARFELRADEITESLNLVDQMILRLPGGALAQHLGELPPERWGSGVIESPRGLHVHWLRADARGTIGEWRVRSASHATWPALARLVRGSPVSDYPLVGRSFNLCVACVDR